MFEAVLAAIAKRQAQMASFRQKTQTVEIATPVNYKFLVVRLAAVDDQKEFRCLLEAFITMAFSQQEEDGILGTVAGILHLVGQHRVR